MLFYIPVKSILQKMEKNGKEWKRMERMENIGKQCK